MKPTMVKNILVLGLLMSLGLSFLPQHVASRNEQPPIAPLSTEYWWPMYRNDPGNTGYTLSKGPDSNLVSNIYENNLPIKYSSPVIVDHKLFIGTTETDQSYLLCIDIDTSERLWVYDVPGAIDSSPAVASGRVFFTFTHQGDEAMLVCLDATSGGRIWDQSIEHIAVCSPIVFFEKVYVCTIYKPASVSFGEIWCFNFDGDIIWKERMDAGKVIPWYSAPAAAFTMSGKYLLVPLVREGDYVAHLYAFNADTGSFIWDRNLEYVADIVAPSPVIAGGNVYITRMDGSGRPFAHRLELANGDVVWSRLLVSGEIMYTASPAVDNQHVYIITQDITHDESHVYCLTTGTGDLVWDNEYNGLAYSSPAVADGKLYFSVEGGIVYCLDTITGDTVWTANTHEQIYSSLAIASQRLFIATFSGRIFAFGDLPEIGVITGGFFSAKTEIRNQGRNNFSDLTWEITATGGIFHLIDRTSTGTIDLLEMNTTTSIKVSPLFGLGNIYIEVIVTTSDLTTVRRMRDGTILGPFVIFK